MVEAMNKLENEFVRKTYGKNAVIDHLIDYGVGGEESARRRCAVDQLCKRGFFVDYFGTKVLYVKRAS